MRRRPVGTQNYATALSGLALAAALAGCTTADEKTSSFYADPGKFRLYPCAALAERAQTVAERERELRALMTRAERDPSGRLIGTLAYRNEYLAARGEMQEIEKTAADKNCPPIKIAPERMRRGSGTAIQ
jgi:hypothetical protein